MALTCGNHKTSISNANAVGMTGVVAPGFIPVNQCMHEHKCRRHGRYNYTAWGYKPGVKTMLKRSFVPVALTYVWWLVHPRG